MADDTFNFHVGNDKNDFSSWIKDIFEEEGLGSTLHGIEDRLETQRELLNHMVKELRKIK
jgi:hypothetical protein